MDVTKRCFQVVTYGLVGIMNYAGTKASLWSSFLITFEQWSNGAIVTSQTIKKLAYPKGLACELYHFLLTQMITRQTNPEGLST